ncbi:hypothetical protein REC12_11730 [Desulfosporosinus sp. PR]|uniref:hypothetical protein n=1 Tax=Candidatus Desulfosporosinus nitrosoreducens TaxID=3401928 RepID=UPI0027EA35D1|nr:hypothetical protein [Desulfosporosinus sp. PR]MDQ7094260.1 hypothetical protein [Desulfosporosinus sp. PR]
MKFDKPILVVLIGALATIPYELFTALMVYLGIGKYDVYELCSLIITLDRPNLVLGAVGTIIVASCLALIFYYSLEKVGWDYLKMKSIISSLISWLILEVFFMWLIEGRKLIPYRPINDYYVELMGTIIFGIVQGLLFGKYLIKNCVLAENKG